MPDEEWEQWKQLREQTTEMAANRNARADRWVCEDALSDARLAAQAACDAVEHEELERAAARHIQRLTAEQGAEQTGRAKLDREREQARADLQAREAQTEALKVRLAALRAHAPTPATSSVPGARSEPKVFNLTGMSASDI